MNYNLKVIVMTLSRNLYNVLRTCCTLLKIFIDFFHYLNIGDAIDLNCLDFHIIRKVRHRVTGISQDMFNVSKMVHVEELTMSHETVDECSMNLRTHRLYFTVSAER
jgi:hypothetical protein